MSSVSSRPARTARRVASSPAVAGFRPAGAALAVAAAFVLHPQAYAQPAGGQAIHGQASFTTQGNNLLVTTRNGAGTNHSAINWQSFSVPGGSLTHFQQPTATSTSINRVIGHDPSAIFGTLSSNGRLVLVNPNGIAVGPGAVVDTNGFTASTLRMTDADAIAGHLRFSGGGGPLSVEGRILARSGDIVLVAPQVQVGAQGVLESQDGATILAAGQKVEITGRGLEGIHLEVQAGDEAVNLGTLKGDAVGMFAQTLRHSGMVQAQAVRTDGGKVVLQAIGGDALVDGSVTAAKGSTGGSIDVLGERVGLLAGANLDASGAEGGGQVRVGGDFQGANAQVPNAAFTYVDAAANIKADATQQGDGGRVIVWADDATRMHGRISARGGDQGGDGGFAEVSGKQYLEFTGLADLRAPHGTAGTLLLDPNDIVIEVLGPTETTSTGLVFSGGTGPTKIKESDLEAQLANSSVLVSTNSGSGGTGRITIADGVNVQWLTANAFGLQADADIDLQGSISGGANSEVSLRALNGGVVQNATTSKVTTGSLKIEAIGSGVRMDGANMVDRLAGAASGAGNNFSFNNGKDLTITTVGTPYGAALSGIKANDGTNRGAVSIRTTIGSLTVVHNTDYTVSSYPQDINAGSVVLQAAGDVNFVGGAEVLSNGSSITVSAGGSVAGDGWFTSGGSSDSTGASAAISLTAASGSVSFGYVDAGHYYSTTGLHGGNVTVDAATNVSAGSIYADGGRNTSGTGGNGGTVKVNAGGSIALEYVSAAGGHSDENTWLVPPLPAGDAGKGGSITLNAGTGVTAYALQASGGSSYGSNFAAGSGNIGGSVVVSSTGGDITLSYIDVAGGSGSTAGNAGAVSVSGAANVQFSDIYAVGGYSSGSGSGTGGQGGTVSITAGGNIVLTPYEGSFAVLADGGGAGVAAGGTGGRGGNVSLKLGGTLTVVPQVGELALAASYETTLVSGMSGLSASGGWGGDSDAAGATAGSGGAGGNVRIERTGGPLVLDSSIMIAAIGGDGGYATGVDGTGGAGGTGGSIDLVSSSGTIVLRSPFLDAAGGEGGWNADYTASGAAGTLGALNATGTSIEVESDLLLAAVWNNSSSVNVHGAAGVQGPGVFRNKGQVNLHDGSLVQALEVHNEGLLRSVAGTSAAYLTSNTGTVEVLAGTSLQLPGLLSNAGMLKADGLLELAPNYDPCAESLCDATVSASLATTASTSGAFVNEATGAITGTGTVVVDGGTGTIHNLGVVDPAGQGSIGTLTLNGNLEMGASSVMAVDILSGTSHDVLHVSGTVIAGGSYAATYSSGTAFAAGTTFNVLQSGALDATVAPVSAAPELKVIPTGNTIVLQALSDVPPPPPPPPPPPVSDAEPEIQQVNNQVITFAQMFIHEALQQQEEEARDNAIGRDDIVVTDTGCKPQ